MHVICEIQLKAGKRDEYLQALAKCLPNILECDGCDFFYPLVDTAPNLDYTHATFPEPRKDFVTVIERWQKMADYNEYLQSSVKDEFGSLVHSLIESANIRVLSKPG